MTDVPLRIACEAATIQHTRTLTHQKPSRHRWVLLLENAVFLTEEEHMSDGTGDRAREE